MKFVLLVLLVVLLLGFIIPGGRNFITRTVGALCYHVYRQLVYKLRWYYNGPLPAWILKEDYNEYLVWKQDHLKRKQLPNVAVVKPFKQKYTETFIGGKIKALQSEGYYVHELYGGYFPDSDVHQGHLLSNNETVRRLYRLIENLLGLSDGYFLRKSFVKYLQRNKVKVVFAEYGTVGAEIFNECKSANVPLVVTFRGYDVHHRKVVALHKEKYAAMFKSCAAVVAVSKDIQSTLQRNFEISQTVYYLPSPVNTDLFQFLAERPGKNVFLYVGRFAESKSPHLVILSFYEVLKTLPDATLIMIGSTGASDLQEACMILVRALKIEVSVIFKGVQTPEQVYEQMCKADVFVQHSLTTPLFGDREGTPVSVREAMAAGLPVVATKHAGIEEMIENGVHGILVEEYDYMAMSEAMMELCKQPELGKQLAANASAALRSNPLLKHHSQQLVNIIKAVEIK